jgi:shikimate kinase
MPPTPLSIDRPIVLVGMMGAGKTSVGELLAERLGLPFVDSDAEIERETGLTIAAIFARFGEAHFREVERRVLARLVGAPPRVIAGGGGAFVDVATRALILEWCISVWLQADPATLAARVGDGGERPLLCGRDLAEVLARLGEQREGAYAAAQLKVSSGGRSPAETVDAVLAALMERAP